MLDSDWPKKLMKEVPIVAENFGIKVTTGVFQFHRTKKVARGMEEGRENFSLRT
jgi:hypothetical protein